MSHNIMIDQLSRYKKLKELLDSSQAILPTHAPFYFRCLQSLDADLLCAQTQVAEQQRLIALYEDRLQWVKQQKNSAFEKQESEDCPQKNFSCPEKNCFRRFEEENGVTLHKRLAHQLNSSFKPRVFTLTLQPHT